MRTQRPAPPRLIPALLLAVGPLMALLLIPVAAALFCIFWLYDRARALRYSVPRGSGR